MFILGVGSAFPEQFLSDDDLRALGVSCDSSHTSVVRRAGICSRAVSLPRDYIQATGNADVLEGWKVASDSPTKLAHQACLQAMSQAGISIESVGLIVADTATPRQTCPSEAQRLGGVFGTKVPAYDVVGGIAALPQSLAMFSAWKEDRVPEYVLYVSTNAPSQYVDFRSDHVSAALFGDAAFACVLSRKHVKGARVVSARVVNDKLTSAPVVIDRHIRCNSQALISQTELNHFLSQEWARVCHEVPQVQSSAVIIPPQLYAAQSTECLSALGVDPQRVISGVEDRGFSIGSSYGIALERAMSRSARAEWCVMMHCGDALRGSVVISQC